MLLQLVIQLIAGAIGGNAAGAVLKDKSLGTLGNTIAGIIGGGVGGKLLTLLLGSGVVDPAAPAAGFDIGMLVQQIVGGGAGGAILMAIVGMIKNMKNS